MDFLQLIQRLQKYDPDVEERILNVYQWGSRVYGTDNVDSDWDFLVIANKT